MDQNHTRYEVLDGMRGIAALTVMIHHFTQFGPRPLFQHAPVAVDLFFMLSGFVIMHSYGSRLRGGMPAIDYIKKRIIRLYPMFLFALFAGVLAYIFARELPLGISSHSELWSVALLNAVFIPFLDYTNTREGYVVIFPANSPLWSLFFEMFASLAFVGLCRLNKKQLGVFCMACFGGLIGFIIFYLITNINLGIATHTGWGSHLFAAGFVRVLFGFALGMFIYRIMDKIRAHPTTALLQKIPCKSTIIALALVVFIGIPLEVKGLYNFVGIVFVMPVFLVIGAMTVCENEKILKACAFLGWISYPLYCLHMPVGMIVKSVSENNFGISFYSFAPQSCAIIITFMVAILVSKFYDEPVRTWLSRRQKNAAAKTGSFAKDTNL